MQATAQRHSMTKALGFNCKIIKHSPSQYITTIKTPVQEQGVTAESAHPEFLWEETLREAQGQYKNKNIRVI